MVISVATGTGIDEHSQAPSTVPTASASTVDVMTHTALPARAESPSPPAAVADRCGPDNHPATETVAAVHTPARLIRWAVLAVIIAVAVAIRLRFLDVETMDYRAFLSRWYDTLDSQGFSAFSSQFADYNYPYLYLLWGLTALGVPSLIGVKAISIVFDFVLAFFAYRIVGLRTDRYWLRALAFGVVAMLPSVIANSSYWGQADAIYSAFTLGGVYFLMRANRHGDLRTPGRSWRVGSVWACVMFGLAVSFKLQAVFVFGLIAWLLIRRRIPWYAMLAIPVVYVAFVIPAVVAGESWGNALSVYLDQTGSYKQLTLGAANLYQLISISGNATWLAHLGIATAGAVVVAFLAWSVWKKPAVTPTSIVVVATASAVVVPFLLPAMHDRYFYTAEVLTVIAAFFLPLWFALIPVLVQASAIGVYHSSLTGDQGMSDRGQVMGGPGGGRNHAGPGRPFDGQGGPGPGHAAGGGHPGGRHGSSSGGYTSGRGDTALTVYATMMGLAVLGIVAALTDVLRRPMGSTSASRPPVADVVDDDVRGTYPAEVVS